MSQTSIRENSIPAGGVIAVTPTSTTSDITLIDTLVAKQRAQVLMERTQVNMSEYGAVQLSPGQQTNIKHLNVGLGIGTWLTVKAHIAFSNTTAANLVMHEEFPFNLLKNIKTEFNGNNIIHNLSGYQLFQINTLRKPHILKKVYIQNAVQNYDFLRTSPAVCGVNGSGTTLVTSQGFNTRRQALTGVSGISASSSAPVDFEFHLYLPFTLREDIPIGLVPLQNNNIHSQIIIQTNDLLTNGSTTNFSTCFASSGTPVINQNETWVTIEPCLEFMNIPAPMQTSDGKVISSEALYSYFSNSTYMLNSIDYSTVNTGQNAFRFSIPNNYLLLGISALGKNNNNLIDPYFTTENWSILINNSLNMYRNITSRRRFMDEYYGNQTPKGFFRFDLTEGVDVYRANLNTVKWLNLYDVNNPVLQCDINAGTPSPIDWSILLETIVPQDVAII